MGNCACCHRNQAQTRNAAQQVSTWHSEASSTAPRRDGQKSPKSPKSVLRDSSSKHNADFVAFWAYKTSKKGEIEMRQGDEFVQLEASPQWEAMSRSWVFVMRPSGNSSAAIGYAPRSLLVTPNELEAFSWNFGAIDRAQAESILRGTPKGTFLIRSHAITPRESIFGSPDAVRSYVLSVKFGRESRHYKIVRSVEHGCPRFTISGDSARYSTLRDMVEDLKSGVAVDILCCALTSPAPKPRPPISDPLPVTVQEIWREVNRRRVRIRSELGKPGSYNPLNIGLLSQGAASPSKVVVVRQLRQNKGALERFLTEAVALKALCMRSSRFVRIMGVVTVGRPFLLIMEYVGEGSLRKYLRNRAHAKKPLPEKALVDICLQVADAMRVMEQQSIVHRSLSAERIFVFEEKPKSSSSSKSTSRSGRMISVKVGGLSWSTALKTSMDPVRASGGTKVLRVKWTAPEALAGHDATMAADVWSYGITVHEIFTHGNEPYAGLTDDTMRGAYLQTERMIERDPAVPLKMYELISKCCRYHAQARLSFSQIHMFLDRYYLKS